MNKTFLKHNPRALVIAARRPGKVSRHMQAKLAIVRILKSAGIEIRPLVGAGIFAASVQRRMYFYSVTIITSAGKSYVADHTWTFNDALHAGLVALAPSHLIHLHDET